MEVQKPKKDLFLLNTAMETLRVVWRVVLGTGKLFILDLWLEYAWNLYFHSAALPLGVQTR
jgi:hypothetical protein